VEYQLRAITKKYDLREDEQRVKYIAEAADFVSTLPSAVQREVYGTRAAEAAGITYEAIKLEINKAYKRRIAREKKKQERIDLAPARNLQPKSKSIRYDNMKSAMAEEALLAMILKEPALLDQAVDLRKEMFSSGLLGNVFGQLRSRHDSGLEVSLSVLSDIGPEEMSHLAGLFQRQQGPVSEQALRDCVSVIQAEYRSGTVETEDDIMRYRDKLKERKGIRK
jgi:DNA primase